MKKIFSCIVLTIVAFHLYSQEMQPVENKPVKTDYLAKSKKQRTVGWILTGTGIIATSFGYAMIMKDFGEGLGNAFSMNPSEPPENNSDAVVVLYGTGLAMLATGISFLSIAKKNKRKALSMSFINETSQQLRYNTVMNTSVPSLCLRLQF